MADQIKEIEKAAQVIKTGGVVVYPTDTVFGIGCRFDDERAVDLIYQIKGRPKDIPFPHLVSKLEQVEELAIMTPSARDLISKHWPGGLTVILQSKISNEKIGFRMPNSETALGLIKKVGVPVIGTSANLHGQNPVVDSKDLDPGLIERVDFVVTGQCPGGVESTVVDATVHPPEVIRQGAVFIE